MEILHHTFSDFDDSDAYVLKFTVTDGDEEVRVICNDRGWLINGDSVGSGKVYDTLSDTGKAAFTLGYLLDKHLSIFME